MDGTETGSEKPMSRRAVFVVAWGMFFAVFWTIVLLFGGGCCNIAVRSESGKRSPYFLQPHPYYSTARVWDDCICAPAHLDDGPDAIWSAVATVTWPLWVVDEACEVVLDTIFLPLDATYYCCKGE